MTPYEKSVEEERKRMVSIITHDEAIRDLAAKAARIEKTWAQTLSGWPNWSSVGNKLYGGHVWLATFADDQVGRAQADYVSDCNPLVIKELCKELLRLRGELGRLEVDHG